MPKDKPQEPKRVRTFRLTTQEWIAVKDFIARMRTGIGQQVANPVIRRPIMKPKGKLQ